MFEYPFVIKHISKFLDDKEKSVLLSSVPDTKLQSLRKFSDIYNDVFEESKIEMENLNIDNKVFEILMKNFKRKISRSSHFSNLYEEKFLNMDNWMKIFYQFLSRKSL